MSWNVQTSDLSACPFLIRPYPSYVQLAREAQSKAVCTRLRQAGIGLASEISEGLVTMFPEKALRTEKTWEKPHGFGVRIPPSKTTCIFGQMKWHSFGIRPPQERIVHQAKFAENIHKVSSAEYSQPGKLHEDWRRHNKRFKFLQPSLLWKQLKAASGRQFTSQFSSLRPSSCPRHIALLLCFFWSNPPMSLTWKSAVKGAAESPDLTQWSRTFMVGSTAGFCSSRNDSTNFRYVMQCLHYTYNKCHDKRNFMQLHRIPSLHR